MHHYIVLILIEGRVLEVTRSPLFDRFATVRPHSHCKRGSCWSRNWTAMPQVSNPFSHHKCLLYWLFTG